MNTYLVQELTEQELGEDIVEILVSAYVTNDMHEAVFTGSQEEKLNANRKLFTMGMAAMRDGNWICVRENSVIKGVLRYTHSPACSRQPDNPEEMGRIMKEKLGEAASRVAVWRKNWEDAHIKEPHWHLGPIAVVPENQKNGMGSLMMEEYCRRMDDAGAMGYLETDVPRNVPFYEKFGFRVTGKSEVLGVTSWFMIRDPKESD